MNRIIIFLRVQIVYFLCISYFYKVGYKAYCVFDIDHAIHAYNAASIKNGMPYAPAANA